jgi:hypothetical protein
MAGRRMDAARRLQSAPALARLAQTPMSIRVQGHGASASRRAVWTTAQANAAKAWTNEGKFSDLLEIDRNSRPHLGKSELNHLFYALDHLDNAGHIFAGIFMVRSVFSLRKCILKHYR